MAPPPSRLPGPGAVDPVPLAEAAISELARLADRLRLLSQEASFAAVGRVPDDLISAAERLLPLHDRFAAAYRSWLAARQDGSPRD